MKNWLIVPAVLVCMTGIVGASQDQSAHDNQPGNDAPPTLHAYPSLLQIPVLVLGPGGGRVKSPLLDAPFLVSLDSGAWFPAKHVRREGDDPIALSVVIADSELGGLSVAKVTQAIVGLAPRSLGPQDRVSLSTLGCSFTTEATDVAADPATLKQAADTVLSSWKKRPDDSCNEKGHLWDSLMKVTESLSQQPGRRVILLASDGEDDGSAHTWKEVVEQAQAASVAVFALKYSPDVTLTQSDNPLQGRGEFGITTDEAPPAELAYDSALRRLCELTGGTARVVSPRMLRSRLKEFATMVRERYVVEFPRPLDAKPGRHSITVRIDQSDYLVHSTGITFPLLNPALLADPTTVLSNSSRTPSLSERPPQRSK